MHERPFRNDVQERETGGSRHSVEHIFWIFYRQEFFRLPTCVIMGEWEKICLLQRRWFRGTLRVVRIRRKAPKHDYGKAILLNLSLILAPPHIFVEIVMGLRLLLYFRCQLTSGYRAKVRRQDGIRNRAKTWVQRYGLSWRNFHHLLWAKGRVW